MGFKPKRSRGRPPREKPSGVISIRCDRELIEELKIVVEDLKDCGHEVSQNELLTLIVSDAIGKGLKHLDDLLILR